MRINIWLAIDNVVNLTTSVVDTFALVERCWSCVARLRRHWVHSQVVVSFSLMLVVLLVLWRQARSLFEFVGFVFMGHPLNLTHVVFAVPRIRHHQIVHFLLRSVVLWRVVTHVIRFIPRRIHNFNFVSVESTILSEFMCPECVSFGTGWHLSFHETEFSFNIDWWSLISSHINVLYGIFRHESTECSQWIWSWMHFHTRLESLRSNKQWLRNWKWKWFTFWQGNLWLLFERL